MNKEKIYILEDRGIIYINEEDAFAYLQNIISNDLNKVTDNQSCFSYLLTPQGKYLFEFIIIKHKNGYFLDCPKYQIENLIKQLNLYKLRSKVEITNPKIWPTSTKKPLWKPLTAEKTIKKRTPMRTVVARENIFIKY